MSTKEEKRQYLGNTLFKPDLLDELIGVTETIAPSANPGPVFLILDKVSSFSGVDIELISFLGVASHSLGEYAGFTLSSYLSYSIAPTSGAYGVHDAFAEENFLREGVLRSESEQRPSSHRGLFQVVFRVRIFNYVAFIKNFFL